MDWDYLRYIHAIGSTGTLQKAAQKLGVHQSTVMRRLSQIEEALGVRLFDRHREGVSLTVAGEEAMSFAEKLKNEVDDVERRLMGHDNRPKGLIRVTTTDTLANHVLGPLVSGFQREFPEIQLEIDVGNPYLNLTKRDADIAIRPTNTPPENLVGRRVANVATAIYGSQSYFRAIPESEPLSKHRWLLPDDSLSHLSSVRWFKRELGEVVPIARVNSLDSLLALVRAGVGIGPLPCFMGDADAGLIRSVKAFEDAGVGLWLLTHRDLRHVARIRAFLDFSFEFLCDRRAQFEGET